MGRQGLPHRLSLKSLLMRGLIGRRCIYSQPPQPQQEALLTRYRLLRILRTCKLDCPFKGLQAVGHLIYPETQLRMSLTSLRSEHTKLIMEKTMNITFTEQELNVVLNALAQRPFAEVFQLVGKIQTEAQAQLKENENV